MEFVLQIYILEFVIELDVEEWTRLFSGKIIRSGLQRLLEERSERVYQSVVEIRCDIIILLALIVSLIGRLIGLSVWELNSFIPWERLRTWARLQNPSRIRWRWGVPSCDSSWVRGGSQATLRLSTCKGNHQLWCSVILSCRSLQLQDLVESIIIFEIVFLAWGVITEIELPRKPPMRAPRLVRNCVDRMALRE